MFYGKNKGFRNARECLITKYFFMCLQDMSHDDSPFFGRCHPSRLRGRMCFPPNQQVSHSKNYN